jgi:hypothetical protein
MIMKNRTIQICLIFALLPGLNACDKNDPALQQVQMEHESAKVTGFVHSRLRNDMGQYLEAIDTICEPYLRYTTKINISNFPNGSLNPITDGNLSIGTLPEGGYGIFINKQDPAADKWWANWNKPPYVENENPAVLLIQGSGAAGGGITLTLSKKCYVFGFELSAQPGEESEPPFSFAAKYYDADNLPSITSIGILENVVNSPSGARLFAIKSDVPFNRVSIFSNDSPAYGALNFGITNIRYLTDKTVYDAHK